MSPCKTVSEREGTGVGLPDDGQVDSCHVWFQVLISNLRKKDSFPGLLHVLIFDLRKEDSFPGLLQVLISDIRKKDSFPGLLHVLIFNILM